MEIKIFVEGPVDANNYLLIDEKSKDAILIDCSSDRQGFIDDIKNLNVNLKYILLTHGHFDHILGVDKFKEVFGVETYVSKEDVSQIELTPKFMPIITGMAPVTIKSIKNYVKDGDIFKLGENEIKAISTPGHTPGGMCYLVGDKLFSGDTLFQRSVGRCDFPGGSFETIVKSIKEKLFTLPDETEVFPGHGGKTKIGYEKKYNEILNI